jgi:hypothetical protein
MVTVHRFGDLPMPEATQICVGLEDKPGMFAKLCGTLRAAEVSVAALFISDDEGCCWVNLVAHPSPLAEKALKDAGYNFFTEKVLTLKLPCHINALEEVARNLAEAGINISYVYGSAGDNGHYTLVLKAEDHVRARNLLESGAMAPGLS